jgi:hypothetical protein
MLGCLTLSLSLVAIPAQATMVVALDLNALIANADAIFMGTVEQSEAFWEDGVILTDATIVIEDCISEQPCREREIIRQVGGQIGDIMMEVAGSEELRPGQQILFFGHRQDNQSVLTPVGTAQGVFHVDSGHLHRDLTEIILLSESGPIEAVEGIPETYSEMVNVIRERLALPPMEIQDLNLQ